jgi:thiol-disulfide isomerase/thioredoxin
MKLIICFLIVIISPGLIFGQKKFEVSVVLPDSTAAKKLSFYYYDCNYKGYRRISASFNNNKATISHSYNTVYARIFIEYGLGDTRPWMSIMTTEKPAMITLPAPVNEADPFKNSTLMNAQDLKQEISTVKEYIKEAQNSYTQMYDSIAPKWKSEDSLDYYKIQEAKIAIENKRLEYICSHPNSYYSFSSFENYSIKVLSPDLLLQRFATVFPAKFRNSEEGVSIKKYILNRDVLERKKKAISFTAKDIDNNKIILKEIYNKKNVLLVFWGTWCNPCIQEIPLLREIRQRYSKEQLEIISVATKSLPEKVRQLIKEQQMDWVHIVNNEKINQLYQVTAYPEVYLIDTKGDIIYKSTNYPDVNHEILKKALDVSASTILDTPHLLNSNR